MLNYFDELRKLAGGVDPEQSDKLTDRFREFSIILY